MSKSPSEAVAASLADEALPAVWTCPDCGADLQVLRASRHPCISRRERVVRNKAVIPSKVPPTEP